MNGVTCVLAETMMNVTCRECPSIELQLPWWLRPALCIMKLMFSKSSVALSACCLLKALKAKLLIVTPLHSALCSLHFSLHCIMFCPFLLFLLSPWVTAPQGNEGVTMNHSSGYEKVRVCACKCTHMCMSWVTVWFRRVGCETREVGREREEQQQRQQHDTDSTRQRPSSLSLFSSSCPWGDTTAAPDTEHHPLTDTQCTRLSFMMPRKRVKGPRDKVVLACYRTTSHLCVSVNQSVTSLLQLPDQNWCFSWPSLLLQPLQSHSHRIGPVCT